MGITRICSRIIKLYTFDKFAFKDAISNEDMTTFHGEDGIDDFAGGGEVKMDRSRSMKCSAIVQIGNAQQVCYLATLTEPNIFYLHDFPFLNITISFSQQVISLVDIRLARVSWRISSLGCE